MQIFDTKAKIAHFTLAALKGALFLESKGMKRRGVSARRQAAAMGFKGNVREQLAAVQSQLDASRAALKSQALSETVAI